MEVVVHSTLPSIQGRVVVATDPARSVDSLITAFCVDKNVAQNKNYELRDGDLKVISRHRRVGESGIESGDILYLGMTESADEWCCGCNQWWVIASVALVIGCVGISAITILHILQNQTLYEYGVVIDAGSTHSQVYVYKWPGGKENGTAIPSQVYTQRTEPGLSSYTHSPADAGRSLQALLSNASIEVPRGDIADTHVYLGATAGMRLLNASDNITSAQILYAARSVLGDSGFQFSRPEDQARILAGRDEGAFSWITVNYISQAFVTIASPSISSLLTRPSRPITRGALDLGGASTQVTFIPQGDLDLDLEGGDQERLVLYGHEYRVYTHSYLCYGAQEALRQYRARLVLAQGKNITTIEDPCRPVGNVTKVTFSDVFEAPCTNKLQIGDTTSYKNTTYLFKGSSDVGACRTAVGNIFDFNKSCDKPPCTFNGVSMPDVYGDFVAFSGFYYPMRFLNLTERSKFSLEEFTSAAEKLCNSTWEQVSQMPHRNGVGSQYCFESVYIRTLLIDGYRFNATTWDHINFTRKINAMDVGWSVGYMLNASGAIPVVYPPPDRPHAVLINVSPIISQINSMDVGWSVGYMLNASGAIPAVYPPQTVPTLLFSLLFVLFAAFLLTAVGFACHARRQKRADGQYQRMSSYGAV